MGKTLIVNKREASELLDYKDAIPAMTQTLIDISRKETRMLQRGMIPHDSGITLGLMPASIDAKSITGAKVTIFASSLHEKTAQGIIPIFSSETGELLSIVDATGITVVRTAATSAAATDLLARKDASSLALIGTGRQGIAHAYAISKIRDIKIIYLFNRNYEKAVAAKNELEKNLNCQVICFDNPKEAVENADIICTTTNSKTPVIFGEWVKKGAHINAVGACSANGREVDGHVLNISKVYVDQMEACMKDAGDILLAAKEGKYDKEKICGEIGLVFCDKLEGRTKDDEITFFESVGLAVEDLSAAWLIYEKAKEKKLGFFVEI